MSYSSIAEVVLTKLDIQYRKISFPDSTLYFCQDTTNRVTFNLEMGLDKCIHIWRFIRTDLPHVKAGMKAIYNTETKILGLEITEEHDLNFFSKQNLTATSPKDFCGCLSNQITEFLGLNDGIQNRYKEVLNA